MVPQRKALIAAAALAFSSNVFALGDCVPGREERVTACSRLSTIGSWEGPQHNSATCTYNPPPGWVIVDHQVEEHSSNNGSSEVSTVAGGSNFISENDLRDAYQSLASIAAEYNVKGVQGKFSGQIDNRYNWHLREIREFEASHNTLQAIVRASAHGNQHFDRKRGWQDISVYARLRCLGEPGGDGLKERIAADIGMPMGTQLYVRNQCGKEVSLALGYQRLSGQWDYLGWWKFAPNGSYFPTDQERRLRTESNIVYIFAESLDGSSTWAGDEQRSIGNRDVRMRRVELGKDSDGDFDLSLSCTPQN